jgi:serine/alanine racemase
MKVYAKALSDSESRERQYYCVDLLKFICALLVVAIHVAPLSTYSSLLNYGIQTWFARIAVPFYFIASGYFLFRKTSYENFNKEIALSYARRIFRLYIIWTIIYFPLILKYIILPTPRGAIFGLIGSVRDFIFSGSYMHLWYLNATIVATLMLAFCLHRKIKLTTIIGIGGLLYSIGLLAQSYFVLLQPLSNISLIWQVLKLVQKLISTTRDGFFEGFFLMGIGMLLAYKPIVIKFRVAILGFVVSMALYAVEVLCVCTFRWTRGEDMYIFLVPSAFFLFYIAAHIEFPSRPIYKHLRELGILIFYSHLLVSPLVVKFLSFRGTDNSLLQYFGTVLTTIIISEFILQLSRVSKFKWLKKIYS